MPNFEVTINGRTPLLMHNNNLEARDAEKLRGHDKKTPPGDDRYPGDKWKTYLYADDKQVVIPTENLLAALMVAGKSVSIGRMKSLKAASQAIFFNDFLVPLNIDNKNISISQINDIQGSYNEQREAVSKLGIELFAKPVTVGTASHVRVRPRFNRWSLKTSFETEDEDLLVGDRLAQLWYIAGRKAGLCDWRPSAKKPGMYGTFDVVLKKV